MSGNAHNSLHRRRSFDLSHTTYGYSRRTSHHATDVEQVTPSSLSLQRTLSQAVTLWPRREQVFPNDEAPLDSSARLYLAGATPAIPEQSASQLDETESDHIKQLNAARRHF